MLNAHVVLVLPTHPPPDQPVNVASEFGTAVSVIIVPGANEVPVGDCVIDPGPIAVVASIQLFCGVKFAVTVVAVFRSNTHTFDAVPAAHTPVGDQFWKLAPEFGTAVKVIEVPTGNEVPAGDC